MCCPPPPSFPCRAASALLRLYLDSQGVLQVAIEQYSTPTASAPSSSSSGGGGIGGGSDAAVTLKVAGDSDPTALAKAIVCKCQRPRRRTALHRTALP